MDDGINGEGADNARRKALEHLREEITQKLNKRDEQIASNLQRAQRGSKAPFDKDISEPNDGASTYFEDAEYALDEIDSFGMIRFTEGMQKYFDFEIQLDFFERPDDIEAYFVPILRYFAENDWKPTTISVNKPIYERITIAAMHADYIETTPTTIFHIPLQKHLETYTFARFLVTKQKRFERTT